MKMGSECIKEKAQQGTDLLKKKSGKTSISLSILWLAKLFMSLELFHIFLHDNHNVKCSD